MSRAQRASQGVSVSRMYEARCYCTPLYPSHGNSALRAQWHPSHGRHLCALTVLIALYGQRANTVTRQIHVSGGCIATDSISSGVRVWVIFCAVPGLQHSSQLDADRIDEPWKNRTGGLCGLSHSLLDMCFHTCQARQASQAAEVCERGAC